VVTSDRGSLPELVVEGEGGFVCDPARPAPFTRALLTLLDDPVLRRKFGAANRERVDRLFRWDHCAAGTARVYEEVLDGWRRRRAAAR
jgi:glycosyltransferase involved in cell wall biosynthesis